MQRNKFRNFIIYSIAFHLLLISAILLYFFKHPLTGGKSGTVMVGVISSEGISNGEPSASQASQNKLEKEQTGNPKIALEQKPVREIVNNQREIKKMQKEIVRTDANKSSKSNQISNTDADKKATGEMETASLEPEGSGTNGQPQASGIAGTNTEIAYPDYRLNPKPKYPKTARKRGYEGKVKLKVFVLANGKVGNIEVVSPSGYEILDQSALEAVRSWVFVPGRENGKEISSWVTVPITFQLKSG